MRAGVSETQNVRARVCKSPRNRQIYAGTPDASTSLELAVLLTGAVGSGEVLMRYLFGFLCVCALGVMPLVGCSDTQPECETSADCNDDNECTNDVCDSASGTCSNTPVDDGTVCSFNGISGVCVSGACGENLCEGVVCEDDGNECTEDVCNFSDGTCNIPVGDGTPCSDGACVEGICTALITVTGTVTFFESLDVEGPPAEGATVSAFGTSLRTTTDASGRFSFDVPEGIVFFYASKEDTWGFIERRHVPKNGTNTDLSVIPDAFVAQVAGDLERDIDETKGIVEPYFDPASSLGGETAMLSEPHDFSFTIDSSGSWVLSGKLLVGGAPFLAFSGVNVTDELTVTPIGVEGYTCSPRSPEGDPLPSGTVYPVVAKSFTLVPVGCTPVP